jgi:hypothetical protein
MALVIKSFRDRFTKKVYDVNSDYEGTAKRVAELTGMGYLEPDKVEEENDAEEPTEVQGDTSKPTAENTKDEIVAYLKAKNIEFDATAKKADLLALI